MKVKLPNRRRALRWLLIVIVAALVWLPGIPPGRAQGDNLLQNPGFDGAYPGRGGISGGVPEGWNVWGNFQNSDHESLSVLRLSAPYSWRLRTDWGQPTGGGYQTVNVQAGATYRFTIYGLIWTCDDEIHLCRDTTHTFSDTSSGGRMRVGIDPGGGTDPYGGGVRWSAFASPFDWGTLAPLTVEARAQAGQMTVFTYYTADKSMRFNDVFWDDASLVMVSASSSGSSGSSGSTSGSTSGNNQAPAATAVPIVAEGQLKPDGSRVHVVQAGQTLWGISQAYDVPLASLREWNNLSSTSTIYVGQEIIVSPATNPVVIQPTAPPAQAPLAVSPPPTLTALPAFAGQTAAPTADPSPAVVNVDAPAGDNDSDEGSRTIVLALALVVVIGAVTATGGLAGYLLWRMVRA